jgi:hypothetical protein
VKFACNFFADKFRKMKEIFRMTGLINEGRPPPPVFSPCFKAGIYAGLFLSTLWFNPAPYQG